MSDASRRADSDVASEFRSTTKAAIRRHRILHLVQAVLLIIGGVAALASPLFSGVILVAILGWLLVIGGLVQAFSLIGRRDVPWYLLQLISAVLSVAIGLLVVVAPGKGLVLLTVLLILYLTAEGIAKIVLGLTVRPLPGWVWVTASGVFGLVLAAWLWSAMPTAAAWLLGTLLGLYLIAHGAAIGALALAVGRK